MCGCCAADGERQRLHISDGEPAEGVTRRYDSPTSSTDEELADASAPVFWSQLTHKVSQASLQAETRELAGISGMLYTVFRPVKPIAGSAGHVTCFNLQLRDLLSQSLHTCLVR